MMLSSLHCEVTLRPCYSSQVLASLSAGFIIPMIIASPSLRPVNDCPNQRRIEVVHRVVHLRTIGDDR